VSECLTNGVLRSDVIRSLRYDDPSASSVMAHRQHKITKLEAAEVKQSDFADTGLLALQTSDMDLTTYSNPPDSDSLGRE